MPLRAPDVTPYTVRVTLLLGMLCAHTRHMAHARVELLFLQLFINSVLGH